MTVNDFTSKVVLSLIATSLFCKGRYLLTDKQTYYSFFTIPFRISETFIMIRIVKLDTVKNTWRDMEDIHRV